MLTYYEIKGIMEKVTILSGHIKFMQDTILSLVQYSDEIQNLNSELENDRDKITCQIRSVEILEDFLKKNIFNKNTDSQPENGELQPGSNNVMEKC